MVVVADVEVAEVHGRSDGGEEDRDGCGRHDWMCHDTCRNRSLVAARDGENVEAEDGVPWDRRSRTFFRRFLPDGGEEGEARRSWKRHGEASSGRDTDAVATWFDLLNCCAKSGDCFTRGCICRYNLSECSIQVWC